MVAVVSAGTAAEWKLLTTSYIGSIWERSVERILRKNHSLAVKHIFSKR
jgi:hypothetical protein